MNSYLSDTDLWRCVCSRRLVELDASLADDADAIAADLADRDAFRSVTPITAAEAWVQQRDLPDAA